MAAALEGVSYDCGSVASFKGHDRESRLLFLKQHPVVLVGSCQSFVEEPFRLPKGLA
jgi:hypothetical protein